MNFTTKKIYKYYTDFIMIYTDFNQSETCRGIAVGLLCHPHKILCKKMSLRIQKMLNVKNF